MSVGRAERFQEIARHAGTQRRVEVGKAIQCDQAAGIGVIAQGAGPDVGADVGGGFSGDSRQKDLLGGLADGNGLHSDVDARMEAIPAHHHGVGQLDFLSIGRRPVHQLHPGGAAVSGNGLPRTPRKQGGEHRAAEKHGRSRPVKPQYHSCHPGSTVGNAGRGKVPPFFTA